MESPIALLNLTLIYLERSRVNVIPILKAYLIKAFIKQVNKLPFV